MEITHTIYRRLNYQGDVLGGSCFQEQTSQIMSPLKKLRIYESILFRCLYELQTLPLCIFYLNNIFNFIFIQRETAQYIQRVYKFIPDSIVCCTFVIYNPIYLSKVFIISHIVF